MVQLLLLACATLMPHIGDTTVAESKGRIVMVTEPWCVPCLQQKLILKKMIKDGLLNGVDIRYTDSQNPTYPATKIPTLYINKNLPLVGVQSAENILKALE